MIIALCIAGWLACAIVSSGTFLAYFQGEWPNMAANNYREDLGAGLFYGVLFGPFGLLGSIFLSGFWKHGWTLLPPKE